MKFSSVRWASLLVLIFWCAAFSQIPQHSNRLRYETELRAPAGNEPVVVSAKNAVRAQDSPAVIETLNPGEIVAGSIPAPAVPNDCLLGVTQYKIDFPGGPRKLAIELDGDQDVDLYLRRGSPIAIEQDKILADFKSESRQNKERLSAPVFTLGLYPYTGVPLLEAGTYFIAVTNCGPGVTNYTLTAKVLGPPDAERVNLTVNGVEVGSIPATDPGVCRVGRTQYAAPASYDPCGSSFFWTVIIRSDQPVNVYVRKGQPITVENGIAMFDFVTQSQAKIQRIGIAQYTPGSALFFIAVENCTFDAANYTVASGAGIADFFPPFITSAFLEKKDLHVVGQFFGEGGMVLLDGEPQETASGGKTSDYQDVLIVKKAKKRIARHQTVRITVKRLDCTSSTFIFTRP